MYDTLVKKKRQNDICQRLKDEFEKELKEPKKTEAKKKYSEKELVAMVKAEQVVILNNYGITKIPTTEPLRVAKILEAQI